MISTYVKYKSIVSNLPKTLNTLLKQPKVKRETEYYTKNISSITSVDEFLHDNRLYNYAMEAWGLEEMTYAKGMMSKVLTDKDYASKLLDKRYFQFSQAFNFTKYGSEATKQETAKKATVNKYMQQTLEIQAGETNEGTRLALYFTRTVGEMAKNDLLSKNSWVYQIISDKALREVLFTALNLPDSIASSNIDSQKRIIESRISYEDFLNPSRLEKFIARFSINYDIHNQLPNTAALELLQTMESSSTLSGEILSALQAFKIGG